MPQSVIRPIDSQHLKQALNLVWEVFCEFEAPAYSEEGVEHFYSYIQYDAIKEKLDCGAMQMWACFYGENLVGVIAGVDPCHISLLFVRASYQRRGVAWTLFNELRGWYRAHSEAREITVNSSPYAVDIYKKLGFIKTAPEQEANGLRYTPMRRSI